jgi:putative FmdB family regulatory protein
MPIYDFKCEECGNIKEYYVPSTTSIPENCHCGKKCELIKMESFSSSKPILNGTGFYETDYKNKMRLL